MPFSIDIPHVQHVSSDFDWRKILMASNQVSEGEFLEYFQKKFGRNAQINAEQAWKLLRKFLKNCNKDTSSDEEPDKSKEKDHHRRCSPHGHSGQQHHKHHKRGKKHGRRSSSSGSSRSKS